MLHDDHLRQCVSGTWVLGRATGTGSGDGSGWVTGFNGVIKSLPFPRWLTDRAASHRQCYNTAFCCCFVFIFIIITMTTVVCSSFPPARQWISASEHTDLHQHEHTTMHLHKYLHLESNKVTLSGFLLREIRKQPCEKVHDNSGSRFQRLTRGLTS